MSGIRIISLIYLINSGLFFLSLVLFYSRILLFGRAVGGFLYQAISVSLLAVSLYLCIRLPRLARDAFWVAVVFQSFFLLNAAAMLVESTTPAITSPLRIVGLYGGNEYSIPQLTAVALSMLLNVLILLYLIKKRVLFFKVCT